jgi:hypothetical protein
MATFYVLPPRACLEESVGAFLSKLLPGLPLPVDSWDAIIDRLGADAGWPRDVFFIPRDELAAGESVAESLAANFGAEPGDRVIELAAAGERAWSIAAAMSAPAAV